MAPTPLRLLAALATTAFAWPTPAGAGYAVVKTFYVDCSAAGTGTGSRWAPFTSVDQVNVNSTIRFNHLHDTDSYGVSAFPQKHEDKTGTTIRGNLFVNNGRNPGRAAFGDVYLLALGRPGATIDGLTISGNTFRRTANTSPALYANPSKALALAGTNAFADNVVVRPLGGALLDVPVPGLAADHNVYLAPASASPYWTWGSLTYGSFTAYVAGSGQDTHGTWVDVATPHW